MRTLESVAQLPIPCLSMRARAVFDALVLCGRPIGTAEEVADRLGLRNRFDLARFLEHEGLPPLHELTDWVSLLCWVSEWERTGASLCKLAWRSGRQPAVCYRTVKRLTGVTWSAACSRGFLWISEQFLARCRRNLPPGRSTSRVSVLPYSSSTRTLGRDG